MVVGLFTCVVVPIGAVMVWVGTLEIRFKGDLY
jgi:hypothetical protein